MVSKPKTATKRGPGRPPKDPADLRSLRFSFRIHPDLYNELQKMARQHGLPASLYLERAVINRINNEVGREILDAIGRYRPLVSGHIRQDENDPREDWRPDPAPHRRSRRR